MNPVFKVGMTYEYTLDQKIEKILETYQRNISLATQAYQRDIHTAVDDLKSTMLKRIESKPKLRLVKSA